MLQQKSRNDIEIFFSFSFMSVRISPSSFSSFLSPKNNRAKLYSSREVIFIGEILLIQRQSCLKTCCLLLPRVSPPTLSSFHTQPTRTTRLPKQEMQIHKARRVSFFDHASWDRETLKQIIIIIGFSRSLEGGRFAKDGIKAI